MAATARPGWHDLDFHQHRQAAGVIPARQPVGHLPGAGIDAAIAQLHRLQVVHQHLRRARRILGDALAFLQQHEVQQQALLATASVHLQRV